MGDFDDCVANELQGMLNELLEDARPDHAYMITVLAKIKLGEITLGWAQEFADD